MIVTIEIEKEGDSIKEITISRSGTPEVNRGRMDDIVCYKCEETEY